MSHESAHTNGHTIVPFIVDVQCICCDRTSLRIRLPDRTPHTKENISAVLRAMEWRRGVVAGADKVVGWVCPFCLKAAYEHKGGDTG